MSPGLGATAGVTAGALGFMGTRGLREGTGEMWRFSETGQDKSRNKDKGMTHAQ